MKKSLYVVLFVVAILFVACESTAETPSQPTATPQATQTPMKRTPAPTSQASYPVCNKNVTNTPCVQFASIQDAAQGESDVGANVRTSMHAGIVLVVDDITNVPPSVLGSATTLNAIQFQ